MLWFSKNDYLLISINEAKNDIKKLSNFLNVILKMFDKILKSFQQYNYISLLVASLHYVVT